jgi:phosphonate metabolism protein (transferase hexapeptide repeat family)
MALAFQIDPLESDEAAARPQIHPTAAITDSVIGAYTDIGSHWTVIESRLGDYSYLAGSDGTVIYTEIGKFCSIASHAVINPGDHPMERVTQHHCTYRRRRYGFAVSDDQEVFDWRRRRPCRIGHDVWIGAGAKVMAGVGIGTGAVVAAGAVVTRDVAPYQVVAGVPARPLRLRFAPEIVARLSAIAWWDWDRRTLEERFKDFSNLERFLAIYG